jgi:hypothetical protein
MKNGDTAKLIQPTIQGTIAETRWNNEQDCKEHRLEWVDAEGNAQDRWFFEAALEVTA